METRFTEIQDVQVCKVDQVEFCIVSLTVTGSAQHTYTIALSTQNQGQSADRLILLRTTITTLQPYAEHSATTVKNWRILPEQSFTASMPLLFKGISAFRLGRRCQRSPQWWYLHHLCTILIPKGCSVLICSRPRSEVGPHHGRTFSVYLCPLILIDSSTGSPVHLLMSSIQAVRGLPCLRAPGIVPCIISFSRQFPCFLMVWP